jgi:lipopolysaccharide transport system permease protein
VLGFFWTLLHPLLLLLVLYLLFRNRLGGQIEHFRIYLLIGIIHWSFFSTATTKAVNSIVQRRELVVNVFFPREILVIGDVGTVLISFVLEILVLFAFIAAEGIPVRMTWLLLPAIVALQTLLVVGFGLLLAGLKVFLQDIERIWTITLRIGFFLVPIFYTPDIIADEMQRRIFLLNPLTRIMGFSREILLQGTVPSPLWMAYTLGFGAALVFLSLRLFKRLEPSFAERL